MKFLPQRVPIAQFGAGGFRFADMSHQGSLLVLPSGMRAWRPTTIAQITADDLEPVAAEQGEVDFLLIGCGPAMARLPADVIATLRELKMSYEVMATAPAVHIYNVTVAEGRRVAAALIAVDKANA